MNGTLTEIRQRVTYRTLNSVYVQEPDGSVTRNGEQTGWEILGCIQPGVFHIDPSYVADFKQLPVQEKQRLLELAAKNQTVPQARDLARKYVPLWRNGMIGACFERVNDILVKEAEMFAERFQDLTGEPHPKILFTYTTRDIVNDAGTIWFGSGLGFGALEFPFLQMAGHDSKVFNCQTPEEKRGELEGHRAMSVALGGSEPIGRPIRSRFSLNSLGSLYSNEYLIFNDESSIKTENGTTRFEVVNLTPVVIRGYSIVCAPKKLLEDIRIPNTPENRERHGLRTPEFCDYATFLFRDSKRIEDMPQGFDKWCIMQSSVINDIEYEAE